MGILMTRAHRNGEAKKPWNSVNASHRLDSYRPVHTPDSQEEIDWCIQCPLPESRCNGNGGCYKRASDGKVKAREARKPPGVFNMGKYRKAMNNGMSDEQIAAIFGVTKKTARRWRRKYGGQFGMD